MIVDDLQKIIVQVSALENMANGLTTDFMGDDFAQGLSRLLLHIETELRGIQRKAQEEHEAAQ